MTAADTPLPLAREPVPRTTWRREVVSRVEAARSEIELLRGEWDHPEAASAVRAAERHYDRAEALARRRAGPIAGLRTWLLGGDIDAAWEAIHAGDELLLLAQPEPVLRARVPELAAAVRTRLEAGDERTAYLQALTALEGAHAELNRPLMRAMRHAVDHANDKAHAQLRNFRNLALGTTLALTVVAVVLAFDAPGDEWLPVCAPDSGDAGCATVPQIELVGALGGLLAVVAALVSFNGFSGPYALPAVMAVLKVPAGALTGLLGAIWMQSEAFGLKAQPGSKILAYVALFGFAQQALTAFADRQAGQLLGNAQGTSQSGGSGP
jgi:hypothetical protein